MAISYVGAGAVATGTSLVLAVPAGYAAGDTLFIAVVNSNATGSFTTPSGWTQRGSTGTARLTTVYTKTATASESSVTITAPNSLDVGVMVCYRGISGFDVSSNANGTSASPATTSITTTTANDYIVSVYSSGASAIWTAPASTTARVTQNGVASTNIGLLIVDELQAAAGASTVRTASSTTSSTWDALAISFSPSVTNTGNFFFMMGA
jgi:hypothetical protein